MNVICATLNAKFIHTNMALRYLKAYAEPEFNVQMLEYTINDPALNIATDLIQHKPDVVGFSSYIWNIEETISVAKILKKVRPDLTIIFGGPEVSYDTYEWMERVKEIDYIIVGEGEASFKKLLIAIQAGEKTEDLNEVLGIAWRNSGEIAINQARPKLDLKTIPSPFRFIEDKPNLGKRISYIETSRGCPFSCQFCLSSIEVGVRYFDKEQIKEDILYLMNNGAKTIKFIDRTFNISRKYALEMFQFLIDEHLPGTVFQFEITADIMRPEVIDFINKNAPAGLFRFEIGIQSTNDYTNELVKRRQNFDKLSRTVTMIKEGEKVVQHLDLIAGLPEEDYQSFRKTFNDVFAMRPEELQLGFLKMLRGTGLRINAEEFGYVFMDEAPYEVLSNRVLSFDEVIKIKQVEDVLEKYWNDHRTDLTIEYLVTNSFKTPFDFFQSFGSYWDQRGWSRIGHQLEHLFQRLKEFLLTKNIANYDLVEGLMKIDYLTHHKHKPRRVWWEDELSLEKRSDLFSLLAKKPDLISEDFANYKLSKRDLIKHCVIEKVPFNFKNYEKTSELVRADNYILIFYDVRNNETKLYELATKKLKEKTHA